MAHHHHSPTDAPPPPPLLLLMGGTFDPPHLGHCLLASDALEATGAERLAFIPAGQNPHKADGPRADGRHRLAMLQAAVGARPEFAVLDLEVQREGPSFAFDTVTAVAAAYPGRRLGWVMGADQWPGLTRWHRIEELVTRVKFYVLARPGAAMEPPAIPGLQWQALSTRELDLSATEIRARLQVGKAVDFFLPSGVLAYIRHHRLYT